MDDESTRRPRFLALGGTAIAAGLAGCLSSLTAGVGEEQPPAESRWNPW